MALQHDEDDSLTFAQARAEGRCQWCGRTGARVADVRHAKPKAADEPWWLAVLCAACVELGREDGRRILAEVTS